MELAYQGLFIRLPFEGAVGVEAFEMNASFNDHVTLRLLLLVEEEKIEALIHGIGDGDDIEVYKAARYRFAEIAQATGLPEGAKREYDVIFGALFHIYQDPDVWNALKAKASDITWTIERIADNRSADGRLDLE